LCVLCNKKKRDFSNSFFLSLTLENFYAYIGISGTNEFLVFNYNKIYEEGIGADETYHRN